MPSEADRRVMLVYLTDEGRKVEFNEPGELGLLNGFDESELESLEDYTERMLKNAEEGFDPAFIKRLKERQARSAEFFDRLGPDSPGPDMHNFGDRDAWMGQHTNSAGWEHDQHAECEQGHGHHGHGRRECAGHGPGFEDRFFGPQDTDRRFFDDRFFDPRFLAAPIVP